MLESITTFVFDIDGVITDGTVTILPDGSVAKTMSVKDGYAIAYAVKAGYKFWIISGADRSGIAHKLTTLGIPENHLVFASRDKSETLKDIMQRENLESSEIAYMGDDYPDWGPLQFVGFGTCPNDADPEIQNIVHWIAPAPGGRGAVRALITKVLIQQSRWPGSF